MTLQEPKFEFDNTYARELEGFYVPWQGDKVPAPQVLRLNEALAAELGLDAAALTSHDGAAVLSGVTAPDGGSPLAMAYAGHQFGGYSPQLGDGRAILVGEVVDTFGNRRDIHLKGSGRTPFSRGGDGKAVLGPVLREYLIGEAMHKLGIPSTRALAAVTTGEDIHREGPQPGAVLARVASSHLRVGTFQFFATRGETDRVRQLADYAIARHYPDLADREDRYLAFLRCVRDAQAHLVAQWMSVGFVHGVMNTDNMTISGETIDYGPCAFIDSYDAKAVFSSIDQFGRYAYANQPSIAQWNLARLAETLLDLIDPESDEAVRIATNEINAFQGIYQSAWVSAMRPKLGLQTQQEGDAELAADLFSAMQGQDVDFTRFFRFLAKAVTGDLDLVSALFDDPKQFSDWAERWLARLREEPSDTADRQAAMNSVNPIYIPRNHLVEEALQDAARGDMLAFDALCEALSDPFTERADTEKFALPAPSGFGPYKTFCGT